MKFSDLIITYPNVLTDEVCDDIINRFENDEKTHPGTTGGGYAPDIKRSLDLHIGGLEDWEEYDTLIYESLSPHVTQYTSFLTSNFDCQFERLTDTGYQIQKTVPGGFYLWHNDYSTKIERSEITEDKKFVTANARFATYIFYLNDVPNDYGGRTKFRIGEEYTITPKKGSLVIFPSSTLYTHCGEELTDGVKYLITGWLYDKNSYIDLL